MSALGILQSAMVQIPRKAVSTGGSTGGNSGGTSGSTGGSSEDDSLPSFAPVTNTTGGTSVGDASAGISKPGGYEVKEIKTTTKDTIAASFLTVGIVGSVIGGSIIMVLES